MKNYDDIIEKNRPEFEEIFRKYPRMTLSNRAKIFAPFSALRGHNEALSNEEQKALHKKF